MLKFRSNLEECDENNCRELQFYKVITNLLTKIFFYFYEIIKTFKILNHFKFKKSVKKLYISCTIKTDEMNAII